VTIVILEKNQQFAELDMRHQYGAPPVMNLTIRDAEIFIGGNDAVHAINIGLA